MPKYTAFSNRDISIALVLLLIVTSLLFYKGITPSFSSDDYVHLAKNIQFDSFRDALTVFTELDGREYRPVVRLSLWINFLMGRSAISFHITNLMIHLGCILCLYITFNCLFQSGRL